VPYRECREIQLVFFSGSPAYEDGVESFSVRGGALDSAAGGMSLDFLGWAEGVVGEEAVVGEGEELD